ncbi:MAG: hypothetical protein WCH01_11730, partial [Methylococcaceae bacterium]
GLIRLLSIGLRVLCLVEFTVRSALQEQGEKLDEIYAGNPKRATVRPTTEMMLRAFVGIHLVTANFGGTNWRNVPPLNTAVTDFGTAWFPGRNLPKIRGGILGSGR